MRVATIVPPLCGEGGLARQREPGGGGAEGTATAPSCSTPTPVRASGATRPSPQGGGEERFPLPHWAHVPGVTAGADEAPLEAAKATVPPRFEQPPSLDHPAIAYGFALYDAGFFWECHEVLEAAWLATAQNSRDRVALRGIIQLANAALKLRMGRPRAALRLLREAADLLSEVGAAGDGVAARVAASGLAGDLRELIRQVESGEPAPPFPTVLAIMHESAA